MSVLDLEDETPTPQAPRKRENLVDNMTLMEFLDMLSCAHLMSIADPDERQRVIVRGLKEKADGLRKGSEAIDESFRWSATPPPADLIGASSNAHNFWSIIYGHLRWIARLADVWSGHAEGGARLVASDRINTTTGRLIR